MQDQDQLRKYREFQARRKKQQDFDKRVEDSARVITKVRELEKDKLTSINIRRTKEKQDTQHEQETHRAQIFKSQSTA